MGMFYEKGCRDYQKSFTPFTVKAFCAFLAVLAIAGFGPCQRLRAQDGGGSRRSEDAAFVGPTGCSSSLCHGGAGEKRGQLPIWKKQDRHARSFATLATVRSSRMTQAMGLGTDARAAVRCTECHAPMASVPEARLASAVRPEDGISCESCHGPAGGWVRSHTREDFSHAHKVQLGVRELRDLRARANACVACHQVLAPDLLAAGHPALLFELDAQTAAEPPHWVEHGRENPAFLGPQAWLVGQAAALREVSWSLQQNAASANDEPVRADWRAMLWVLRQAAGAADLPMNLPAADVEASGDALAQARTAADNLARAGAGKAWNAGMTRRCLLALAGTHREFAKGMPAGASADDQQARSRARRLALGLSRLLNPMLPPRPPTFGGLPFPTPAPVSNGPWERARQELDGVFMAVDAAATFDPAVFTDRLAKFETAVIAAQ